MSDNWKQPFLDALADTGIVARAARAAGVGYHKVSHARKNDPDFAAGFELAMQEATDALEGEARRRAVEGVEEPVFYLGAEVGAVRKYSDSLLALLLKGRRKEVFADRTELTGADGGAVKMDGGEREQRIAALLARAEQRKGELDDLL